MRTRVSSVLLARTFESKSHRSTMPTASTGAAHSFSAPPAAAAGESVSTVQKVRSCTAKRLSSVCRKSETDAPSATPSCAIASSVDADGGSGGFKRASAASAHAKRTKLLWWRPHVSAPNSAQIVVAPTRPASASCVHSCSASASSSAAPARRLAGDTSSTVGRMTRATAALTTASERQRRAPPDRVASSTYARAASTSCAGADAKPRTAAARSPSSASCARSVARTCGKRASRCTARSNACAFTAVYATYAPTPTGSCSCHTSTSGTGTPYFASTLDSSGASLPAYFSTSESSFSSCDGACRE
mmetsp:Transcript_20222/g.62889  ORF Transcript_20222/g.62889 Transcript_20222/m.62889 type:complete len:304 (+) Transcript_20222:583-1494(+)